MPKFTIPEDEAAIATITYTGTGNFVVWSIAADGTENDLLVNEIGRYKGTVLFDAGFSEHSVAMKVEASGAWSIVIKPITEARIWADGATAKGSGDDVILLETPVFGFSSTTIKHSGSSNFVVFAYTAFGDRDLLVNEIGRYSGEVLLPAGTMLMQVTADGAWSMTTPAG